MKQTVKINESQLQKVIKNVLLEFRDNTPLGFGWDGDAQYVRPTGNVSIRDNEKGKTFFNGSSFNRGKRAYGKRDDSVYDNGKGAMCWNALKHVSDDLQIDMASVKPDGKVQWTPKELKLIDEILYNLRTLARLSKSEAIRTRGQVPQAAEE